MLPQLPLYVKHCFSDNILAHYDSTLEIRKLLSISTDPPIQEVIDSGVVPRLIQFAKNSQHEALQFQALWCLTNIASGSTKDALYLVQNNSVPIIVNALKSSNTTTQQQSIWALSNIAGTNIYCRDIVLSAGTLSVLLPLLKQPISDEKQLQMIRCATWALSNFCRGQPSINDTFLHEIYKALQHTLYVSDVEVIEDTCWALRRLVSIKQIRVTENEFKCAQDEVICSLDKSNMKIQHHKCLLSGYIREITGKLEIEIPNDIKQMIFDEYSMFVYSINDSKTLKRLIELLDCEYDSVKVPILETISNVIAGSNRHMINCIIYEYGLNDKIKILLKKKDLMELKNLTRSLCRFLSLLFSKDIVSEHMDNGLVRDLIKSVKYNPNFMDLIIDIILNEKQCLIEYMVKEGVMSELIGFIPKCDDEDVIFILESIEKILKIVERNVVVEEIKKCDGLTLLM
eukprot:20322_1